MTIHRNREDSGLKSQIYIYFQLPVSGLKQPTI